MLRRIALLAIAAPRRVLAIVRQPAIQAVAEDVLAGSEPLDAITTDDAIDAANADGAQNGVMTNGAARVTPGHAGSKAITLDGTNDKVLIGSIASTANVGGITV